MARDSNQIEVAALKEGDRIAFYLRRELVKGKFVRLPYSKDPARSIFVAIPGNSCFQVAVTKLERCCTQCGCTETTPCLDPVTDRGCHWMAAAICSCCMPSQKKRAR